MTSESNSIDFSLRRRVHRRLPSRKKKESDERRKNPERFSRTAGIYKPQLCVHTASSRRVLYNIKCILVRRTRR